MYLIDTDILIYSLKGNTAVRENFIKHLNAPKAISVISYGELYFGAKKSKYALKNLALVRQISESFPVIEIKKSVMETFGELKAKLQSDGIIIPDFDLIIASTALNMNYILVTNNEKHFNQIPDLTISNWAKS